ncbi:MAG: hypothetical protein KC877_04740, partial [Candidatus Kaiserbacteria bacterium]|nr:hypothetical protein [Candidatus Kaiserbacteria bacterium]
EHYKFDERGRTLTICQGGEELQLYPKVAGKPLIISLVTNTDDEKYYLAGKYPEEFVNFLYPWQVPGSTQNIHRLTPKPRQKADEEGPIEAVALAMGQPGVRFLIRQQR